MVTAEYRPSIGPDTARNILPLTSHAIAEHRQKPNVLAAGRFSLAHHSDTFRGIFESLSETTFTTYNPSSIFYDNGNFYRAVRVDSSDGQTRSVIFKQTEDGLVPDLRKVFKLEDPFANTVAGELVFGGVKVVHFPDQNGKIRSTWKTVLYRGTSIDDLRPFFEGPVGMKDIRPVEQANGKIGVYTRPRDPENEDLGGDGQIGYREFGSLDEIEHSPASILEIQNTPLLNFRFPKGEWGGVNHTQVVKAGRFRNCNVLLAHRAYKDLSGNVEERHYAPGILVHNPESGRVFDFGIVGERSDLPEGPRKEQDESKNLKDVYFGTELVLLDNYRARVTGGISDYEIGWNEFPNPLFLVV